MVETGDQRSYEIWVIEGISMIRNGNDSSFKKNCEK